MRKNYFLSASVPLPTRSPEFYATADVVAIREAVKALALEACRGGTLTFGGHPAITPLLAVLLRSLMPNRAQSFILYQSEYFFRFFPKENDEFIDVRVTPPVEDNRSASLRLMREKMLTHTRYDAAFFIGGMEGVIDEYEMLGALQPKTPRYPIASTGGASLLLHGKEGHGSELLRNLTYPTLFRNLIDRAG